MFNISWPGLGKRAAILFGAIWISKQEFFQKLLAKFVEVDDSDFGADDVVRALFYSAAVEFVVHGRNYNAVRILKRAALIAAAIFGSQTTAYAKIKVKLAQFAGPYGPGLAATSGTALDAFFSALVVELGSDLF